MESENVKVIMPIFEINAGLAIRQLIKTIVTVIDTTDYRYDLHSERILGIV